MSKSNFSSKALTMPKVTGTFPWECWLATPSFLSASALAGANQALFSDEIANLLATTHSTPASSISAASWTSSHVSLGLQRPCHVIILLNQGVFDPWIERIRRSSSSSSSTSASLWARAALMFALGPPPKRDDVVPWLCALAVVTAY